MSPSQQHNHTVSLFEKKPQDRVPEIMRSEGRRGVEEVPAGWGTTRCVVKGEFNGQTLTSGNAYGKSRCFLTKPSALMTTGINTTLTSASRAAAPSSQKPANSPSKSSPIFSPSKHTITTTTTTTTSTNPTTLAPSPTITPKPAIQLELEFDDTFSLTLRANDMFSLAVSNAQASFSTPETAT
ncbi:hypothetical protein BU17DRAFT_85276 [Hysterangium stoloniferum]|nr:hypothetical protein BU17DRAFT_85276 [Hysterangium stoloniferum]